MPTIGEITGLRVRDIIGKKQNRSRARQHAHKSPAKVRRLRKWAWEQCGGICQLGGEPLTFDAMTLDRINPGESYTWDNVQASCLLHNAQKGNHSVPKLAFAADDKGASPTT